MARRLYALVFWVCVFGSLRAHGAFSQVHQNNLPNEAQMLWDEYRNNLLALHDYQPGCEPTHVKPKPGTHVQGVIILLHGFTSCPKQFFKMADHFSNNGFHVLLPTLPGHGRAGLDELQEQESLPGSKNWFIYGSFAHWLNRLAKSFGHEAVHIGGLCLGGTIASQAMQLDPSLYSRGVLLSPYFEVSKPLLGRLGRWVGRASDIINIETQLSHPIALQDNNICENVERKIYGIAGYCKVRFTNLIAVSRYAFWIQKNWRGFTNPVQTLLVENDGVAHLQTTLKMLEGSFDPHETQSHTCVLNEKVTHSLFSPTDLPLPKPWLPELHTELLDFLAVGVPMQQSSISGYSWPRSQNAVSSCQLFPVERVRQPTISAPIQ